MSNFVNYKTFYMGKICCNFEHSSKAMNSVNVFSSLISYLIIYVLVSCVFEEAVYADTIQDTGFTNRRSEYRSNTYKNQISNQKRSVSFYKTDSIFSFRSQKGYFPSLVHNIGEQAAAPFHFKAKQWLYTGAAVCITTALIFADEDIDDWARTQKQKHKWVNKSSPFITEFGSNYGVYSVIAYGLISAGFKNEKGVQTSLLATQAMITSGIWAQLIKQLTGRERPKASYIFSHIEGGKWHGIFAKYLEVNPDDRSGFSYDAFPSGHTATAFSIATVFATQYHENKAVPILFYSAATLVGISRLTEHEHWASDVFVGALLGYLSGKQVVQHYNRTHQNNFVPQQSRQKNKTEITFIQYGNQIGISMRW
jgi:membrane-associated phospholipid phosphatase